MRSRDIIWAGRRNSISLARDEVDGAPVWSYYGCFLQLFPISRTLRYQPIPQTPNMLRYQFPCSAIFALYTYFFLASSSSALALARFSRLPTRRASERASRRVR